MGREKPCSDEKRKFIKKMLEEAKTFAEINRILGCSNKMISNAKKLVPKVESRGRKPVMSPLLVKRLRRQSKQVSTL